LKSIYESLVLEAPNDQTFDLSHEKARNIEIDAKRTRNAVKEDRLRRSEGKIRCNHGKAKIQTEGKIVNHKTVEGRLIYRIQLGDQANDTSEKVWVQKNEVTKEMVATYKIGRKEYEKRKQAQQEETDRKIRPPAKKAKMNTREHREEQVHIGVQAVRLEPAARSPGVGLRASDHGARSSEAPSDARRAPACRSTERRSPTPGIWSPTSRQRRRRQRRRLGRTSSGCWTQTALVTCGPMTGWNNRNPGPEPRRRIKGQYRL
jgi:hypothetical protein